MKRAIALVIPLIVSWFVACAHERPPPRVCEAPPPTQKPEEIRIGACPVEWGADSGTDALGATVPELDAQSDG